MTTNQHTQLTDRQKAIIIDALATELKIIISRFYNVDTEWHHLPFDEVLLNIRERASRLFSDKLDLYQQVGGPHSFIKPTNKAAKQA